VLPVIGLGGISNWRDAIEFLIVGAAAVQVGTALFSNPRAMNEIVEGMKAYCLRHNHASVREIIGTLARGDLIQEGIAG